MIRPITTANDEKKKVNITLNSWTTSHPYPHYNFTKRFLILLNTLRFLVISGCVAAYFGKI